jgi:hypothetical protein
MDGLFEGVIPYAPNLIRHILFSFTSKQEDLHHKFQRADNLAMF